jgi:hypothetical protein
MDEIMNDSINNSNIYDGLIAKLGLSIVENNIIAVVTFNNVSSKPICVPFWYILTEGLTNNNFFVINEKNEKAKYIGMMAKRGEPKESDLIEILPGAMVKKEIKINEFYIIPLNSKEIRVKYFVSFKISSNVAKLDLKNGF